MPQPGYFQSRVAEPSAAAHVTPLPGGTYIQRLRQVLGEAKTNIDIMQYQWNWYPHKPESTIQKLNQEILGCMRRGVKIRVIMNQEGAGHRLTTINLNTKNNLEAAGAKIKLGQRIPIVHAKYWIIDDDICILGSHNLSQRSVTSNDEVSAEIRSREFVREVKNYFELAWGRY